MYNTDNYYRGFYILNRSWYASEDEPDEIMFGLYSKEESSTIGELSVSWKQYTSSVEIFVRMCAYTDSWSILSTFKDLFDELAKKDNKSVTLDEFVNILKSCNFKDITNYNK